MHPGPSTPGQFQARSLQANLCLTVNILPYCKNKGFRSKILMIKLEEIKNLRWLGHAAHRLDHSKVKPFFYATRITWACTACWTAVWHLDVLCYEGGNGHGAAYRLSQPRMELAERSHEQTLGGDCCWSQDFLIPQIPAGGRLPHGERFLALGFELRPV